MKKTVLTPKKQPAPAVVPYLCALCYVIIAVCIVLFILQRHISFITLPCSLALILVWTSRVFSWYEKAEVRDSNEFMCYEVTELVNTLGHNKTKYHIRKIDTYKVSGDNLVIFGDIMMYAPLKKGKAVKKVVVRDYDHVVVDLAKKWSRC